VPHPRTAREAPDRKGSAAFSNYREWRAFLVEVQVPAACTSVATALAAGHAWLTGGLWADRGDAPGGGLLGALGSRKTLGV
jgi:hypothetical protein